MKRKTYRVEKHYPELGWRTVWHTKGASKEYCTGWVNAMDSLYPSKPHRIVQDNMGIVVYETKGRGEVHTN